MLKHIKHLGLDVEYLPSNALELSDPPPPEVNTHSEILKKGSIHREGAFPLPCNIIVDYDVRIPMRDGITLYADIFRPDAKEKVPAILVYTPYCKRGGWWNTHFNATNFGVDPASLSGLQAFEAPDPGFWCDQGYAVVVVDAAGTCNSEGDQPFMGKASAERTYDAIEFVATLDWCTGKVGMTGNSQLGMIQWATAALKPPHLVAIAPWEGLTDQYREVSMRGGIPDQDFNDNAILPFLYGLTHSESLTENCKRYPLMNAYWEDKKPELKNIDIPVYVIASWTSPIHTRGTLQGFREISSTDKWLRIHNTQEWIDIADRNNALELKKFFDRYLKDIRNGWQGTPKVRLSVLDPGGDDIVNRVEREWPLARQQYVKLYLNSVNNELQYTHPETENVAVYDSEDLSSCARFVITATQDMEITGYINLHMWVAAVEANDLDIFAALYKEDANGKRLHHITLNNPDSRKWVESMEENGKLPATLSYTGPVGRLRVSRRALDLELSTPTEPVLSHKSEELVSPGEIVPVDLTLWPTSMLLHPGERLVIEIAGHVAGPLAPKYPPLPGSELSLKTRNHGQHCIYTGGQFDSYLTLPVIPQSK